jgi:hypothetical protein
LKTKQCTFCGEPMAPQDKECKQCGWDSSNVKPPAADPGDQRARIFVALGLAVSYFVVWSLLGSIEVVARPAQPVAGVAAPDQAPPALEAVAIGGRVTADSVATTTLSAGKLLTIKVADVKAATILPRGAIHYDFELPETDQSCKLVGRVKSGGGDVEVFLLTGDQYVFWNMNPAAIPHSDWEPMRGVETPLDYALASSGTYHLIVSNYLSATAHKVVQVQAQVRCTTAAQTAGTS